MSGADPLAALRQQLLEALSALPEAPCCALVHYPSHSNVGDHLIWLGEVQVLDRLGRLPVAYASDQGSFSGREMGRRIGSGPVLMHGGGYLGDLWQRPLTFIERIVAEFRERPVVLLPQTIHYRSESRLQRTAAIFAAHPRLTVFVRDHRSLELARRHFPRCQLVLSPDMALALELGELQLPPPQPQPTPPAARRPWLALARCDLERGSRSWLTKLAPMADRIDQQDWLPLERRWIWGDDRLPGSRIVAAGVREGLQRRLRSREEWQQWRRGQRGPAAAWLEGVASSGCPHHTRLTRRSLGMLFEGHRQLAGRSLVLTDRLHGQILASLAGIPSLLFDNSYPKNQGFMQAWGANLPLSRYVEPGAVESGDVVELALRTAAAGQPTGPCRPDGAADQR
jgi:exopolysaccharide biosynthesis predicted pyruvyltransferase EpsI